MASVGGDEPLSFWDGLLKFDWVGAYFFLLDSSVIYCLLYKELVKLESLSVA